MLSLGKARQHIVEEIGKLAGAQAGHFQKDGRIATQVVEATDHANLKHNGNGRDTASIADLSFIVNVI